MGEWNFGHWSSPVYVISQVFILGGFSAIGSTYFVKKRWLILCIAIVANLSFSVGYVCLGAWVGLGMCLIAIPRDITNYIITTRRPPEARDKFNERDFYGVMIWASLMIVFTVVFQGQMWTWFGFFGAFIFMCSICQKNILVYRLLGVMSGLCWIVYSIFNESFVGVMCECILLVTVIAGIITYLIDQRKGLKRTN